MFVFPEWYGLTRPDAPQKQSQINDFATPTPKEVFESITETEGAFSGYDCADLNANEAYDTFDETPRLSLTGDTNKQIVIEPTEILLVLFGWEAADEAYSQLFVDDSDITVEVNEVMVRNTTNCWTSPIKSSTDTYIRYWILPLEVSDEGTDFYFLLSLKKTVMDGFDLDEDGELDVYFNDWEYQRTIVVDN